MRPLKGVADVMVTGFRYELLLDELLDECELEEVYSLDGHIGTICTNPSLSHKCHYGSNPPAPREVPVDRISQLMHDAVERGMGVEKVKEVVGRSFADAAIQDHDIHWVAMKVEQRLNELKGKQ